MQKEIGFAMAVAALTLTVLYRTTPALKPNATGPAAMIRTKMKAVDIQLNWGLKAIHAHEAQSLNGAGGGAGITVAIIDTGCDINHPDLTKNIWTNPGEAGLDANSHDKRSNEIDDDGNGFVDDVHGWNFVTNSPVIMDDHGHGTHIAGIVGGDNGVAPQVSLMILKYYDEANNGEENLRHTVQALQYAVDMGAQIINYSGGGILKSVQEERALKYAALNHVLVVAAAGNEGLNTDFFHFYPADYDLPNILSVAAVDRHGRLLDLSNYGRSTVDVAAPGRNIYSALPDGEHGFMSGTSQATAFVSGVAALMMAKDPALRDSPEDLISHLLKHGRKSDLLYKIGSGQMLDAQLATADVDLSISAAN